MKKKYSFSRSNLCEHLERTCPGESVTTKEITAIVNGYKPDLHRPAFLYLQAKADKRLKDFSQWERSVYLRVFGEESHKFATVPLSDIQRQFIDAARINEGVLKTFSDKHCGIYRFARYSMQADGPEEESILCGVIEIFPYQEADGTIRCKYYFQSRVQAKSKNPAKNHDVIDGLIFPFTEHFIQVGIESGGKYPVFVSCRNHPRPVDEIHGLVLRKHPGGKTFASRIIHKRIQENSLEDAKNRYMGYITTDTFDKEFDSRIKTLLNVGQHDGKGVLTSLE
jgi:hypothetical protein